jgi:hypothetical protein
MDEKLLMYGDYLLLWAEEQKSYLSAPGFTDSGVFIQVVPDNDLELVHNSRSMVLEVIPKLSYENAHEYQRALQKFDSRRKDKLEQERLDNLQQRMVLELDLNDRTIQQRFGEPVLYGSELQLRHVASQMMLRGKTDSADTDRSCYKLELSTAGGNGTYFKVTSKFKFRQEGDRVVYGDHLNLFSVKLGQYVHVSEKIQDPTRVSEHLKGGPSEAIAEFRPADGTVVVRYEVNISMLRSPWLFVPYSRQAKNSNTRLEGGRVVRLYHTEREGYLASDGVDLRSDGRPEVFIRQNRGEDETEKTSCSTLFIVEVANAPSIGSACTWTSEIRLRHLTSGRLLTGVKDGKNMGLSLGPFVFETKSPATISTLKSHSVFRFEPTSVDLNEYIHDSNIFKLKFAQTGGFLSAVQEEWIKDHRQIKTHDNKFFNSIESEDSSVHMYKLLMKPESSEEDTFILQLVDPSEVRDIEFVMSTQHPLDHFCAMFRYKVEPDKSLYAFIEAAVAKINEFVTQGGEDSPFASEGLPVVRKQRYLRELKLIDLACNLLYYPFESKLHDIRTLKRRDALAKVLSLLYRMLKLAAMEYTANEVYCAQWIAMFLEHCQYASDDNDLKAEETLVQIIDNNKTLLVNEIKPHMIEEFVIKCKDFERHERYIRLISSLCTSDGEAIVSHQSTICDLIVNNPETCEALMMRIRARGNDLEVYVKEYERWVLLTEFEHYSSLTDNGRLYNYFLSVLELVSELSFDRNYQADKLRTIYTLDIVYACASNEWLNEKIRAAFVKIILHLHINQGDVAEVTFPNYTRVWNELNSEKALEISSSKAILPPAVQEIKKFVYQFLVSASHCMRAFEPDRNLLIKEVLVLAEFMISYGFYATSTDLNTMLDPLVCILDGTKDIMIKDEFDASSALRPSSPQSPTSPRGGGRGSRYTVQEGNLIIMECKQIICKILAKSLDIRSDLRMSRFFYEFKSADNSIGRRRQSLLNHSSSLFENGPAAKRLYKKGSKVADISRLSKEAYPVQDIFIRKDSDGELDVESSAALDWLNFVLQDPRLDLNTASDRDFVSVMLDLLNYQHTPLVNGCFKLLLKTFSQRQALMSSLREVQLMEGEAEVQMMNSANESLRELSNHSESAEFWLGMNFSGKGLGAEMQTKDQIVRVTHERVEVLLRQLINLCSTTTLSKLDSSILNETEPEIELIEPKTQDVSEVRRHENPDMSLFIETSKDVYDFIFEMFDSNEQYRGAEPKLFTKSENPNTECQRLLRNLKAYEPVLEIVKFRGIANYYDKARHYMILRYCYVFLAKFCRGNPENQAIIAHEVDAFIQDVGHNLFALGLVREIYYNNLPLTKKIPLKLFKSIINAVEDTPFSPKKCSILRSCESLIKCSGKYVKNNQIEVMGALARGDRDTLLKVYNRHEDFSDLERTLNALIRSYLGGSGYEYSDLSVPDDISYLMTLLELMAHCCDEKVTISENLAQGVLSLGQFQQLMKISGLFWPLKKSLVVFFAKCYMDMEFIEPEDEAVLYLVFDLMAQDFDYIIEHYTKESLDYRHNFDRVRLKLYNGSVGLKDYALHYVFRGVLPCLQEIISKRGGYFPVDKHAGVLSRLVDNLLFMYEAFERTDFRLPLLELLRVITDVDSMSQFLEGRNLPYADFIRPRMGRRSVVNSPRAVEAEQRLIEDNSKGAKLQSLLSKLKDFSTVELAIEKEFEEIARSFMEIKSRSVSAFGTVCVLEPSMCIASLIKLMDPEYSSLEDQYVVMGVKILRKLVEMENKDTIAPAAEWDTEDWENYEAAIVQRQNFMADLGTVQLLCALFVKKPNTAIRVECILTSITLLIGGNPKVQGKFLECFEEDRANDFLLAVKDFLIFNFEKTRKRFTDVIYEEERAYKELLRSEDTQDRSKNPNLSAISADLDEIIVEDEDEVDELFEKEDLSSHMTHFMITTDVLRFLQLLCEGHNASLQNYLREQRQDGAVNAKSYDFVYLISTYLGTYIKILHSDNLQLGYQILDTLTEVVQGPCRENQRSLSQAKIIDNGRDLLTCLKSKTELVTRGFEDDPHAEEIGELKSKTVNFLLSLLEGDADDIILKRIAESLDFKRIIERMTEVFSRFVKFSLRLETGVSLLSINSRIKKDSFEGPVEEGFNLSILLNKLTDEYPPARVHVKESSLSPQQLLAYSFFRMHTGRIEVLMDGVLQRSYFPIQPICKHISENSKQELMMTVDRQSPTNKIIDMVTQANDLIEEMKHNDQLKNKRIAVTPEKVGFVRDLSMLLVLLINYLLLFHYDHKDGSESKIRMPEFVITTNRICGYGVILLNVMVVVGWYIIRAQLVVKKGWRILVDKNAKSLVMSDDDEERALTVNRASQILLTKGPDAPEFNAGEERDFKFTSVKVLYWSIRASLLLGNSTFRYYCFYLFLALFGLMYQISYSLMLLDVVYRFPTLRNVLASVMTNSKQLLMTAMLGLIIIYIYAFWGFNIDTGMYFDESIGDHGESQCQSLWHCFLTTVDLGLRSGGGIADALERSAYANKSNYYQMFLFGVSFFLVVIIVLLNIIFGIIIDTFAQLRDLKNFIEEDMRTKCFICNIDRYTFDRNSYGFEKHIKEDHNVWQYLYFMVHLQEKDSTEYNGTESYCAALIDTEDISWVPLHRAICLKSLEQKKDQEKEASEEIKAKIQELESQVRELVKIVKANPK